MVNKWIIEWNHFLPKSTDTVDILMRTDGIRFSAIDIRDLTISELELSMKKMKEAIND